MKGVVDRASLHAVREGEDPNTQDVRARIICLAVYGERRLLLGRDIKGAHGRTIAAWYYIIFGRIVKYIGRCRGGARVGDGNRGGGRGSSWGKRGSGAGSEDLGAGYGFYICGAMIVEELLKSVDPEEEVLVLFSR